MKYKKFIITNYRAIEFAEVGLSNRLIPLIGINESGKTSVLFGILAFHRQKDSRSSGNHLEYINRYSIENVHPPAVIKAEVVFDSLDEVNAISDKLSLNHGTPQRTFLIKCFEESNSIMLTRNLETKTYAVESELFSDELNTSLATSIYDYLPHILYFEDFMEKVDKPITFPAAYHFSKKKDDTTLGEWRFILDEIFRSATNNQYSIKQFIELPERSDKRDDILRKVNRTLNKDIMSEWEELIKRGIAASENRLGDLKLEIKYVINPDDNKKHEFSFKLIDSTKDEAGSGFDIPKRSTGFNWFFNFILKLKYNPDYRDNPTDAIYLLDEPGANLHSSGQEGLLRKLKEVAERNQVIFGTHSQYLLDPEVINLKAVGIVEKKDGVIQVVPYGNFKRAKHEGALTPLIHALHLKVGYLFPTSSRVIVAEGITDYYWLKLMIKHRHDIQYKDIHVVPGTGAAHLKNLISLAIGSTGGNYLVFLDNDEKGRKAKEEYERHFGSGEATKFVLYAIQGNNGDVLLEHHLSEKDKSRLAQLTSMNDVKKALSVLYYMPDDQVRDFVIGLDSDSRQRLSLIAEKLNSLQ
jgi:predicted ATP-dependent endonuclease of OLD family